MLAVVDARISKRALKKLENYATILLFETKNIVYPAISGHPDIFIFQNKEHLIVAPNIPKSILHRLEQYGIVYDFGLNKLGQEHPFTTWYNASAGDSMLICKPQLTDDRILKLYDESSIIEVNQSYTRCSTLIITKDFVLTSDAGIKRQMPNYLYFEADKIILPGFKNGFLGGCLGLANNTLFVNGNADLLKASIDFQTKAEALQLNLIELDNGPLTDIGSILFIDNSGSVIT